VGARGDDHLLGHARHSAAVHAPNDTRLPPAPERRWADTAHTSPGCGAG
jgi:hypothetical protein